LPAPLACSRRIRSTITGSAVPLPFSAAEYARRLATIKQRMSSRGVDVLLTTEPGNMNYLTGYDAWSFYVHQGVVVGLDEPVPMWIGRPMDASGALHQTFLGPENIYSYPEHYVQSTTHHPMERFAEVLHERGLDRSIIGVEMDGYYFTAASMASLRRCLPSARFEDCTALINRVRAVKTVNEIACMEDAAQITDLAMQIGIEAIAEGVRHADVAAEVWRALVQGTPAFSGDYPASQPKFPTGRDFGSSYHLTWTDQSLLADTATGLELSGTRHRYHAPLARTVYLGRPPDKMWRAEEAMREGMAEAFAVMRPGATADAVDRVWLAVSRDRYGFDKQARIGYSVGLSYPPTWADSPLSLRVGDDTVLEENMTFHFIPSYMVDGWGLELSETVRVTPNGGKPFSALARELTVKSC
jgi:ectoine hydrolase